MVRGSRGPSGYPDWQRQVEVTSPVLSSRVLAKTGGELNAGLVYVGNFSATTGRINYKHIAGGPDFITVAFRWFTDKSASILAGQVLFSLNLLLTPTAYQFLLPNLGPFVFGQILPGPGGGEYEVGWSLSATSREQATVSQVEQPVLLQGEGTLPAGFEGRANPRYNFSGPCSLSFKSSQAGVVARLLAQDVEAGRTAILLSHQIAEANVFDEFTWETPMGSWEVGVLNNSGVETTYEIQALPSITGAS